MLSPDLGITEMSENDARESDEHEREELWWYVCQIETGVDPSVMLEDEIEFKRADLRWNV